MAAFATDYILPKPGPGPPVLKGPGPGDVAPHAVALGEGIVPQSWSILMTSDTGDYRLEGTVTGFDGSGNSTRPFGSRSGQIAIDPALWRHNSDLLPDGKVVHGNRAGDKFVFNVVRTAVAERSLLLRCKARVFCPTGPESPRRLAHGGNRRLRGRRGDRRRVSHRPTPNPSVSTPGTDAACLPDRVLMVLRKGKRHSEKRPFREKAGQHENHRTVHGCGPHGVGRPAGENSGPGGPGPARGTTRAAKRAGQRRLRERPQRLEPALDPSNGGRLGKPGSDDQPRRWGLGPHRATGRRRMEPTGRASRRRQGRRGLQVFRLDVHRGQGPGRDLGHFARRGR